MSDTTMASAVLSLTSRHGGGDFNYLWNSASIRCQQKESVGTSKEVVDMTKLLQQINRGAYLGFKR